MKRNYFAFLFLTLLYLLADPAYGQRMLGARRFDFDDNAGNHIFMTNSLGSIGINNSLTLPNSCALLDLSSLTKGFLVPRMNALQEASVCSGTPPEGLIVYNTTTHSLDIYNGTLWGSASGWSLLGNGGTNPVVNFLGTTDAQDLVLRTNNLERMRIGSNGNIGIGTSNVTEPLFVSRALTPNGVTSLGAIDGQFSYAPTASGFANVYGIRSIMTAKNTFADIGIVAGYSGFAVVDPSATAPNTRMIGATGIVDQFSSTSAVTTSQSVYGELFANTGMVTDGDLLSGLTFISNPAVITNSRGLHVHDAVSLGGGTITNLIGVDIDQLTLGGTNTAFRYNHPTQPILMKGNGDVQIGALASGFNAGLIVSRTSAITAGAAVANEAQIVVQPPSASSALYLGTYSHADAANAVSLGSSSLYGLWGGAELYATATAPLGNARGVLGELFYQTNQPLTDGAAFNADLDIEGTGTIFTLSGLRDAFQNTSTATITNLKLLNVLSLLSNAGTITNTYGLYIGDITLGTQTNTPYSIFASDPNAWSFMDGRSGFGSFFGGGPVPASTPVTTVDISGSLGIRFINLVYAWGGGAVTLNTNAQEGFINVNPTGAGTIVSFNNPANGRIMIVHKVGGSAQLTFSNEDPGEATPGNRIHCMSGANVVINGEALITFIYEGAGGLNRWLIQSISQF
ncbi:MAG: hypothetical protein Q8916_05195 [Bacteroidota bacterium]|nr:hypothetical protein [Bacteroidota bacterium]MDP4237730.1 hypothetical protein [Bacteroidota bacterium]